MFHVDATYEDCRFIAHSKDGRDWAVTLIDNFTGTNVTVGMTADLFSKMLVLCTLPGEPGDHPFYDEVHNFLVDQDVPMECYPIP